MAITARAIEQPQPEGISGPAIDLDHLARMTLGVAPICGRRRPWRTR
jgi:hypothetical protein